MAITVNAEWYYNNSTTASTPNASNKIGFDGGKSKFYTYVARLYTDQSINISQVSIGYNSSGYDGSSESKYLGAYIVACSASSTPNSSYIKTLSSVTQTRLSIQKHWNGSAFSKHGKAYATGVLSVNIPKGYFLLYLGDGANAGDNVTYTRKYGGTNTNLTSSRKTVTITYNPNNGGANTTATVDWKSPFNLQAGTSKSASTSTYTITFNGNGVTPSFTSRTATKTTSYTFSKWKTGSSEYSAGASYTATANTTFTAQYSSSSSTTSVTTPSVSKPNVTLTRTVSFKENGETISSSATSTATQTHSCNGWYTATSGGTKRASNGGSYTPTSSETLYAQWATPSVGSYSAVSLPTASNRVGFKFLGWSTAKADETKILTGTTYTPTSDGTTYLYGVWQIQGGVYMWVVNKNTNQGQWYRVIIHNFIEGKGWQQNN